MTIESTTPFGSECPGVIHFCAYVFDSTDH